MGILDKIKEIELEMSRTQKNKATEYHLGLLKAKLARYRSELIAQASEGSGGKGGEGFEVSKAGDARGKSPFHTHHHTPSHHHTITPSLSLSHTHTRTFSSSHLLFAALRSGDDWLPIRRQVHTPLKDDQDGVDFGGLRVHHADLHPRRLGGQPCNAFAWSTLTL
jgi:hypothetical protein